MSELNEKYAKPTGVNMEVYRRPGGFDGGVNGTFCGAPHPDNPDPETEPDNFDYTFCRRMKGHPAEIKHAAYTFSVRVPEMWDVEPEPTDLDDNTADEEPPF